ncbi:glycosyltransferase family 4 protein [Miltoncostaea marina]|uniref:glycosyltransferase family 4 protein n=1 Tax=Miltoncostaea marina TaxID=2843215 RepID=UPI001C3D7E1C|nr:glycosyltransferase family 4 protein [Miltoncostaea marina]
MRILALPRDPNPYQEQLYRAGRRRGARVRYLGELTPSRTLNLLLLPFETLALALAGWRTVHLHWVFGFAPAGADRLPAMRRAGALLFRLWLRAARLAGARVVWTAHNVLPHARVFPDDAAERRRLVTASDLVIAHSAATLAALERMGARPRAAVVLPLGPIADGPPPARVPGSGPGPRRLLFLGQVLEHKGVEDLLAAMRAAGEGAGADLRLVVAGRCPDRALAGRLRALAAPLGGRVRLRLEQVPGDELTALMGEADAVVLPFRRITTSSSARLALEMGRPLIVPALLALDGLPDAAVMRYDGSVDGLAGALGEVATMPAARLAAMSAAALADRPPSWDAVAAATLAAMGKAADAARPAARPAAARGRP